MPITQITSNDGSVSVTSPFGPVTDLSTSRYLAIPYLFSGTLKNSISPAIVPRGTLSVVGLSGHLTTVSTSDITIALLRDGTAVATLTVPANNAYAYLTFPAVIFSARVNAYSIQLNATSGSDLGGEIELQ